jgi:hypothetical protein
VENCIGFRATFQEGQSQHFVFEAAPPALWLHGYCSYQRMPKILKSVHSRKMKGPVSEDYCQLTNISHILCHVHLPKLQSAFSGPNCHTTFCVELVLPLCPNQALL